MNLVIPYGLGLTEEHVLALCKRVDELDRHTSQHPAVAEHKDTTATQTMFGYWAHGTRMSLCYYVKVPPHGHENTVWCPIIHTADH